MKQLCYCELSSEVHLVDDETCCEICDPKTRKELNEENVEYALKFYRERYSK